MVYQCPRLEGLVEGKISTAAYIKNKQSVVEIIQISIPPEFCESMPRHLLPDAVLCIIVHLYKVQLRRDVHLAEWTHHMGHVSRYVYNRTVSEYLFGIEVLLGKTSDSKALYSNS